MAISLARMSVHLVRRATARGRGPATGSARRRCVPAASRSASGPTAPVTVLPQPDSPTTQTRLAATDGEVDAVDRLHDAVVGGEMGLEPPDLEQRVRSASASITSPSRIERVAQAVADEVDGEHGQEDRGARQTAPNAGRCRDSPWRRRADGPRSECRAESRGPGTTASIPR